MRDDRQINYDHVVAYLESFDDPARLADLKDYAAAQAVPIVEYETERMIHFLLATLKAESLLEIGTAIGYSAISFAREASLKRLLTLELRDDYTHIARQNIASYGLEAVIEVRQGDALDTLQDIDETFDVIFMDAAKGQYQKYYDLAMPLLKPEGVLICDNVLFRGQVTNDALMLKRTKTMVQRLRRFLDAVLHDDTVVATLIPIGDGVLLVRRQHEKN
ncbi:O-methyltransferase [Peptoniphilus equinus]|uniref:tRNA 5-hydroxyuridine methyltransferase n=1 Tax=Peptoniphilus equinus TaxID=3016343 RepID=A0ABY7QU69_9FIRM|nr:O-methyltransferase [Peptoniphilus equinus]WBW50332.1 O-methyltransferase [Peptoniphilus equinus]